MILLGSHTLKAHTRKQKIIARSSAEAELYAAAVGASESKSIVSLLKDRGYELKPVLGIDAATETHSAPTRNRTIETHRCSILVETY